MRNWTFRAKLERVVDGDTFDLIIDLGFGIHVHQRVRLKDVDTAEVYGVKHDSEEYELGQKHSAFVKDWFNEATGEWPFNVTTKTTGKYGRYLADVEKSNGEDLATTLKAEFDL